MKINTILIFLFFVTTLFGSAVFAEPVSGEKFCNILNVRLGNHYAKIEELSATIDKLTNAIETFPKPSIGGFIPSSPSVIEAYEKMIADLKAERTAAIKMRHNYRVRLNLMLSLEEQGSCQ